MKTCMVVVHCSWLLSWAMATRVEFWRRVKFFQAILGINKSNCGFLSCSLSWFQDAVDDSLTYDC
eukprot:m.204516 g.204516  ORF g.204516 m.204516 type:complete len:65 (+) comp39649_c0_seq13:2144-2338(+)